jgi:hypothetical protein
VANDRRAILALVALTCWLGLASSAAAQIVLSGVVSYPSGRVAANVTVVAEKEDTGETWDARTSSLGLYAFYRLPNGTYTVRVSISQLSFLAAGVEVRPRQKTALDIPLCMCREEVVIVHGRSALPRRLSDGSLGAAYSHEAIDGLFKSNGDNLQSVLIAMPGLTFTESVGTMAQYTAVGQRRFANRLTIDGVSADLAIDVAALALSQAGSATLPAFAATGGTQTLFPMYAIDDIQVRTTNAASEYARSPGAQTVIVTRSGTDQFKASTETQIRPDSLAARNWFENAGERPQAQRYFRGTNLAVGGPILPRRLFYFGTWERQHTDRSVFTTVNVPSLLVREALTKRGGGNEIAQPVVNAYPLPNGREFPGGRAELTGEFPVTSCLNAFGIKIDATLSDVHRSFVRFHRGTSRGDSLGPSYVPSYSFANEESTLTKTTTVGLTSAWQRVTHDLRANISSHRGSVVAGPAELAGAAPLPHSPLVAPGVADRDAWISIALPFEGGLLQSGRNYAGSQDQLQFVDTWSFLLGRHEWRAGLEYQRVTATSNPAQHRYSYRFTTTEQLVQGLVQFVLLQNIRPATARRESWAAFAADTFRVSPRLSLNYGLRYSVKPAPFSRTELTPFLVDFDSLTPNELPVREDGPLWNTSLSNVAPRVAATYQAGIKAGWETSIRAGASLIFDDRSSSGIGAFGAGYGYVEQRGFPNSPFPVPANNLSIVSPPSLGDGDSSTYYSFPKDLRTPRTYEWHFGIDQNLGRSQQLSVAYVGGAGRDLIYWHTYDVGLPLVNAYSNDARSDYHAMLVEYVRRRSRGFQGSVSYTWSHALDNDSGEGRRGYAPPQLISPAFNYASADFDRRHVLRMVGSYELPALRAPKWLLPLFEDWQVDAVLTAQTGTPVSITYSKVFDSGTYIVRPDSVDETPIWIVDSSKPGGQYINRNAFVETAAARPGMLGRNTLRSFPLRQVDASLARSVRLGQRLVAQLRIDAFNLFNTPSFGPPSGLFSTPVFGVPDRSFAESLGTGTLVNGGLMPLQQIGGARSLQFSVRLSY